MFEYNKIHAKLDLKSTTPNIFSIKRREQNSPKILHSKVLPSGATSLFNYPVDRTRDLFGIKISSLQPDLMAPKPVTSPVPEAWYPTLAVLMISVGLIITASFFIYEATSSRKNRSLAKELTRGSIASIFLGFGSLFLLLASGVYV
ncbi:unnamed protein product [Citrullus colocynthis]|uniref:Dolichyl-diphosphooligosaccharide-protein glycosyltransferase subunit OST5 n=1 Tax=Citrullus colocynthis TaxID=252529 RepID=A0ABP0Z661_9ROSI